MSSYWVNFAKTGDPNGPGLPTWPVFDDKATNPVLYLGTQIQPGPLLWPVTQAFRFDSSGRVELAAQIRNHFESWTRHPIRFDDAKALHLGIQAGI